jgi:hypothetical protein
MKSQIYEQKDEETPTDFKIDNNKEINENSMMNIKTTKINNLLNHHNFLNSIAREVKPI